MVVVLKANGEVRLFVDMWCANKATVLLGKDTRFQLLMKFFKTSKREVYSVN